MKIDIAKWNSYYKMRRNTGNNKNPKIITKQ